MVTNLKFYFAIKKKGVIIIHPMPNKFQAFMNALLDPKRNNLNKIVRENSDFKAWQK